MAKYWRNSGGAFVKTGGVYIKCPDCPCGGGGSIACDCCLNNPNDWLITLPSGFTDLTSSPPNPCNTGTYCPDLSGRQVTVSINAIDAKTGVTQLFGYPGDLGGSVTGPSTSCPTAQVGQDSTADPCVWGFSELWTCRTSDFPSTNGRTMRMVMWMGPYAGGCAVSATLQLGYNTTFGSVDWSGILWCQKYLTADFDCNAVSFTLPYAARTKTPDNVIAHCTWPTTPGDLTIERV